MPGSMKPVLEHIREHLLQNLPDGPIGDKSESLEDLIQSEWSAEFETLMRNRLLMGRFRYGKMNDPLKGDFDCVGSMVDRLRLYQETGNLEHLVDVANLALVEFVHSKHPNKHFDSSDDGVHCNRLHK